MTGKVRAAAFYETLSPGHGKQLAELDVAETFLVASIVLLVGAGGEASLVALQDMECLIAMFALGQARVEVDGEPQVSARGLTVTPAALQRTAAHC